jgi:hypothetical protein
MLGRAMGMSGCGGRGGRGGGEGGRGDGHISFPPPRLFYSKREDRPNILLSLVCFVSYWYSFSFV